MLGDHPVTVPGLEILQAGETIECDLVRQRSGCRFRSGGSGRRGGAWSSPASRTQKGHQSDAGQERRWDDTAEATQAFEDKLRHAVRRRLRADVPVVCYISGGLDSTVVLGLCTEDRNHAIRSFTVGFDGAGPDERASSTESAAVLNSHLTTVTFNRQDIAAGDMAG